MPALDYNAIVQAVVNIALILLLAWIALLVLDKGIARLRRLMAQKSDVTDEPPSETQKRIDTLTHLLHQGGRLIVLVLVVLVVLSQLGVPIGPILAGAGVVGLAVGFGAQSLVRDIIAGFFIILENQVRRGDVAVVNGTGGLVEQINFRTLVLRDLSGTVHIFPNGAINTLSNMTNEWSGYVFELGIAYKENTDAVIEVIQAVGAELQQDAAFGPSILEPIEVFGVDKFNDSGVVIKGRIKTRPIRQWATGREFLRRIKQAFDAHGIEIPFPHRTLYVGAASPPFPLRMVPEEGLAHAAAPRTESH
jgi:moderate conductance mechanosensitive channel